MGRTRDGRKEFMLEIIVITVIVVIIIVCFVLKLCPSLLDITGLYIHVTVHRNRFLSK